MNDQDKLQEMFRLQWDLNVRVGVPLGQMSDPERNRWLLEFTRAIGNENSELIDSCSWKWWKKNQPFDQQNAKVEVVDLFHFVISAAQVLGMSADDVYEAYLKKNQVNHQRQDTGYVVKDENDCRHI